ncbi:D-aminoacyl-tRNA deacylase [Thermosipho atlanticus]|uniref:D-aminoacyl-tRNA deacylase n=1 Tax=Thermosipho atlanticus DSM 15807 TaxID=1123380 RepID=A0A1M5QQB8_9BACT|nr:D-aminoacyl-tRNA deacylase [Thermosipho atlanticus]SHH16312.1 D-tyrosyl-tRNA(Tyr) deacylase [Thermosipho atlanticus DSM 15807]
MRAVIQRVLNASVNVNGKTIAKINKGILVLLGVGKHDTDEDAKYLSDKIVNLRIFDDEQGKMNLSLIDIKGELLIVSQFTLFGDCRRGRRPSYSESAPPTQAKKLYEKFIEYSKKYGLKVETGTFGAYMEVSLINDGPVTLLLDSKKVF